MISILSINSLKEKWLSLPKDKSGQIRIDSTHKLDLFISLNEDGNLLLYLITDCRIPKLKSSSSITVTAQTRTDGKIIIIFELINFSLVNQFVVFCYDLLEKSRPFSLEQQAVNAFFENFTRWFYLFDDSQKGLLSDNEIKGLIGELLFIKTQLVEKGEQCKVIDAWRTLRDAERDFVFQDYWYEIKAIASSSDGVSISSIEQLNHDSIGELWIYFINSTESISNSICLPNIISEIYSILESYENIVMFSKKIFQKGYDGNNWYTQFNYVVVSTSKYLVDHSFPSLSRTNLPTAISSAKYTLNLGLLSQWKC